jgi:cell division protein FtsX
MDVPLAIRARRCQPLRAFIFIALVAFPLAVATDVRAAHRATTCYVDIYFVHSDTVAEKQAVAAALRSDPLIASFRYVSRKQALAAERKQYPDLVKNLTSNPLPDSFRSVPKAHVDSHKVIVELKARKFRGVANIAGHTADSLDCGYLP